MTDPAQIARSLTKAQKAFLLEDDHYFASGYKPGEKLVELGLLGRRQGTFGDIISITDVGIAVRTILLQATPDA